MIWTIIEAGLAIIASSLATIRPLLRAMRVRGFEGTDSSTGHSKRSLQRGSGCKRPAAAPAGTYSLNDLPASNERLTECLSSKMSPARPAGRPVGRPAIMVTEMTNLNRIAPAPTAMGGNNKTVYVIQGTRAGAGAGSGSGAGGGTRSTWSGRSTESMEQIHDLEAQNQEYPTFGIGSDSEI